MVNRLNSEESKGTTLAYYSFRELLDWSIGSIDEEKRSTSKEYDSRSRERSTVYVQQDNINKTLNQFATIQ